ncbi:MAG: ParB/RepB/Spo0J family partition protein [Myxococcaceae bacterium]
MAVIKLAAPAEPAARPPPRLNLTAQPGDFLAVDLDLLDDNPFQPRADMDEAKLSELAASIAQSGLLQPVAVRPAGPGRYQIVAGHRRVAAFRKLKAEARNDAERRRYELIRTHVVAAVGDREMAVSAYVENAQRDNLNAVEEAAALARIKQLGGYATAKDVSAAVGQNEQRVRRLLRLDAAPAVVKEGVTVGVLVGGAGDGRRERRRLDLIAALEFTRLFEFYDSKKPKDAAGRTEVAVRRALSDGWGTRRIQDYVEGVLSGRPAADVQVAPGAPKPQPAAVTDDEERLVVFKKHLATAPRKDLEAARAALTRQLEEVRSLLAGLPAPESAPNGNQR